MTREQTTILNRMERLVQTIHNILENTPDSWEISQKGMTLLVRLADAGEDLDREIENMRDTL